MAKTFEPCPRCGEEAVVLVGQAIIPYSNDLGWSRWTKCDACGYVEELDDRGLPPKTYRDLMASDGLWDLTVDIDSTKERALAALFFKEAFGLTAKEATRLVKKAPGIVWTGTEVEVEWLCSHLRRRGIKCAHRRHAESEET